MLLNALNVKLNVVSLFIYKINSFNTEVQLVELLPHIMSHLCSMLISGATYVEFAHSPCDLHGLPQVAIPLVLQSKGS